MSAVIDGFPVDVTVSEVHSFPGEATRFPVEVGADFTDHIRELPDEIALECIVSDTPIGEIASHPTRQSVGPEAPLPSAEAFQRIREMKRSRRQVVVETSRGTFADMACVDFEVTNDKDKGGGLFFSIKFQRVEIVTNRRTRIRVATPMAGAGGKAKATKKTVDSFAVGDTYLWRQGVPPGAPLAREQLSPGVFRPKYEWAIVQFTTTAASREVTSQQRSGGIFGTSVGAEDNLIVYRYSGEASSGLSKIIRPGSRLTNADRAAFIADFNRDRENHDLQYRNQIKNNVAALPTEAERQLQNIGPPNRNLPPGVNLRNFTTPPPGPTFQPQGPNTTFPVGTPVIGGR